jgi:hypothetical protein
MMEIAEISATRVQIVFFISPSPAGFAEHARLLSELLHWANNCAITVRENYATAPTNHEGF